MSKRSAQVVAAVIGVILAIVVSIAVIAYTETQQTERAQVRSRADIERIAARVFRKESREERARRIQGAAKEAIILCRADAECVAVGRDLFGPSRARLLAHARKAIDDHCQSIGGCKGDRGTRGRSGQRGPRGFQGQRGRQGMQGRQGPQGVQGPQGPQGPAGVPGATVDQVIANLCARNSALVRLLCR